MKPGPDSRFPLLGRYRLFIERLKVPGKLIGFILKKGGWWERGLRNAADIQIVRHTVALPHLPPAFDGYQLLVLSDFHIDGWYSPVNEIIAQLQTVTADALLLLGDYRYRIAGPHQEAVARMCRIIDAARVRDGCYAVRGNHDSRALMDDLNGHIIELRNRAAVLTRNGERIYLIGVDDPHYDRADDLQAALASVPPDGVKILLAHTGELYRQAATLGIDLYLCGHTHGGQIRINGWEPIITNVRAPRAWTHGFWRYRDMRGYTTSGVGASAVQVRFNCPPEMVLFTLKRGHD